jgi:hypothetical protein
MKKIRFSKTNEKDSFESMIIPWCRHQVFKVGFIRLYKRNLVQVDLTNGHQDF